MKRIDLIRNEQIEAIKNDKLYQGWFIYSFNENFKTVYEPDLRKPPNVDHKKFRSDWVEKAIVAIKVQ